MDTSWTAVTTSKTISMQQESSGSLSMWDNNKAKVKISGQPLKTNIDTLFQGQQIQMKP